jgi:hypothetical protein
LLSGNGGVVASNGLAYGYLSYILDIEESGVGALLEKQLELEKESFVTLLGMVRNWIKYPQRKDWSLDLKNRNNDTEYHRLCLLKSVNLCSARVKTFVKKCTPLDLCYYSSPQARYMSRTAIASLQPVYLTIQAKIDASALDSKEAYDIESEDARAEFVLEKKRNILRRWRCVLDV